MKGSTFIKAWNPKAVCSFSHQRARTKPTSGPSNKHSFSRPALSFAELCPILKATQILQLNWKNDEDVMEGIRLAIPFGSDGYSQPHSIWWWNVYCINANWCSKEKPCSHISVLKWKYCNLPDPWILQSAEMEFQIVILCFFFLYSDSNIKQRIFHQQYRLFLDFSFQFEKLQFQW